MLHLVLWPILAVWAGLAFVVLFAVVVTIAWGTAHLMRDEVGAKGDVWCPVYDKPMKVRGIPRRFLVGAPFLTLRRCERWGTDHIKCGKWCLRTDELIRTEHPV